MKNDKFRRHVDDEPPSIRADRRAVGLASACVGTTATRATADGAGACRGRRTRVPEPAVEVPVPIEVFTGQELTDRGARDLESALALATGVTIAPGGDGGPASSVPEFWGLKEFDAFLLVVDGVPWGGAFNPALATLSLTDIARIEVMRGPAPVTYGATSFVGVIHVVHKTGDRDVSRRQRTCRIVRQRRRRGGSALLLRRIRLAVDGGCRPAGV